MEFDEKFLEFPYGNSNLDVSQYGRVRDRSTKLILEQFVDDDYLCVKDPINGSLEKVHRLVALTWVENDYAKAKDKQVHHKDKNIFNNRMDNLELLTEEEHEKLHGRI